MNYDTQICASIANPRVTLGPLMHNAAIQALGLDYLYLSLEPSDLAGVLEGLRALGLCGFSVSKPFKEKVIPLLDEVDIVARDIGAVNTIHNVNGKLKGYNSDWIGAVRAIEEQIEINGKKIIIVGAGGVGRAIAFGLRQKGGKIYIYNRTKERAEKLAKELDVNFGGGLRDLDRLDKFDIIVNATSVGSHPNENETIIPQHILSRNKVAMDVIFNPQETLFMRNAIAAGCKVVYGTRMLVLQGAFQFELFTNHKPPLDVMQNALLRAFNK